jgi:hypothetical protein
MKITNNSIKLLLLFFSFVAIFLINGCRKDPCDSAPPLSASFKITEVPYRPYSVDKEPYDTDSVSSVEVKFIANELNANSYEWKIGSDSRTFTGKELQLRFQNTLEKEFDVTLRVVKSNPCFMADTVKTFTRTFYFRPSQLSGTYEGYFSHSSAKALLKIDAGYIHPNYYTSQYPYYATEYAGVLLSGIPIYDTLFISSHGSELLNQRVYVQETMYSDIMNKTLMFPNGGIYFYERNKEITVTLNATEIKK